MRKALLFAFAASLTFLLTSCSINSDVVYHKDTAMSMQMDMDFRELMSMMKSQGQDSVATSLKELEKFPREWTSLYDLNLKEGKKKMQNEDSIRLMKKAFIKGNFLVNELTGMSVKFDRMSKDEFQNLSNLKNEGVPPVPMASKGFNQWDGKKLVIDTESISFKDMEKLMGDQKELEGMDPEQLMSTITMMLKKASMNLKFENKIKSIQGKHDWIQKIDDYTVQINMDTSNLDEHTPLKNKDKQIIITTE